MTQRPRHIRHRSFERLRHSDRFKAWIAEKAAALEVTEAELFEMLKQFTFEQLPTEPEEE